MDSSELADRIRSAAEHEPTPQLVAQKVLADLSAADQRDVLALVLPGYARSVMTEAHRNMPRPPDQPPRGRVPGVFHSRDGKAYSSARRRDFADWHALVGTSLASPSGRKFFGDFGVTEVQWLATERRGQAERILRRADQYQLIAAAMEQAEVDKVRDLPQTLLVQLMATAEVEEGLSKP